ncbi:MAG: DUF362 domain-containing protein [Eubacteriaceae bacterium]|nr:DUF362 domain-containing protein [Eubacteriaceae bacterium]
MKSKVFFADRRKVGKGSNLLMLLENVIDASGTLDTIAKGDLTAIKLHFGEPGNTTFLQPVFVRKIVEKVRSKGGDPFLTDSNTLYFGGRDNSVNHMNSAIQNGFAYAVVDAPIIIADGLRGRNTEKIQINKKHFKEVLIAGEINQSDAMIVLSHVKGHELAGFGGAVKNLAMGCASAAGKQQQHSSTKPMIKETCIGCSKCTKWCRVNAITVTDKKAILDYSKCVGCGECIAMCPVHAIKPQWETDGNDFQERMTEYAYGAAIEKIKAKKIIFVNFVMNVTPHCDCKSWSDAVIVPDVGILVSTDPVAIDKASVDLINAQQGNKGTLLTSNLEAGGDKFAGVENRGIDTKVQFNYGMEIGLGSYEYDLIRI